MKKLNLFIFFYLFIFNYAYCQWTSDVRLTTDVASLDYPSIATSGSYVHTVWQDYRIGGNLEIYYKSSDNEGTDWSADIRLTNNDGESYQPCIASSGSNVHVVWWDYRDFQYEIYYKRSTNNGLNWEADTRITNTLRQSSAPSISVSGLDVHIVWEETTGAGSTQTQIYYIKSTDNGLSWGTAVQLNSINNNSLYPVISAFENNIHVSWYTNNKLHYRRSTNAGNSWLTDTLLVDATESVFPSIGVNNNMIHLIWRENNSDIRYKNSTNGGASWSATSKFLANTTSARQNIAVQGSVVVVAWNDGSLHYMFSTDGGEAWSTDTVLSTPINTFSNSLAIKDNNVHIIFAKTSSGNKDLYYKKNPNQILPVELSSFSSSIVENNVKLNWITGFEINNAGFEIERRFASSQNEWMKIGYIPGAGNSNSLINYSYSDYNLRIGKYNYRLKQIDFNGNFRYYNLQNEIIINVPEHYILYQNYPNPFNPKTNIKYSLPKAEFVTIKVYDVAGKIVSELVREFKEAGNYLETVDGTSFASGIYFYQIKAGDFTEKKRMVLVK